MSLDARAFVVGAVGRLEKHKGFHHLLDAFERVAGTNPEAYLVVVGDGTCETELRDQATGMGDAASRILFTGYRPDADRFMLAFDLLVLPSTTHYETFGQVLMEAMAFGVPVIGSEVGGIPEIIEHEVNGLLVPPADPEALAAAVARVQEDDALRQRLARQGEERVATEFTEQRMLDQVETFLLELLET
jgi:glycosyltransferase involved in cell wall biosynthesis